MYNYRGRVRIGGLLIIMESQEKISVVIADDHPGIRSGIRRMLGKSSDISVVAEASDGQEAIEAVQTYSPDVLILDIRMPVIDGITVIDRLNQLNLHVLILVLSAIDDPIFKLETLSRGACRFLCKDEGTRLVEMVQRAAEGECEAVYASDFDPLRVKVY